MKLNLKRVHSLVLWDYRVVMYEMKVEDGRERWQLGDVNGGDGAWCNVRSGSVLFFLFLNATNLSHICLSANIPKVFS
jgi:hypothetical protein